MDDLDFSNMMGDPVFEDDFTDTGVGDYGYDDYAANDTFGGDTPASGFDIQNLGGLVPTALGATRIAGGLAGNPGRLMSRAGGAIMAAGRRFPVRRVWDATKRFGVDFVAGALGMSAIDLVRILIDSRAMSSGRRRRRGISSRDVRTTKRVVRFVNSISHDIGCVRKPHFTRRKSCP